MEKNKISVDSYGIYLGDPNDLSIAGEGTIHIAPATSGTVFFYRVANRKCFCRDRVQI